MGLMICSLKRRQSHSRVIEWSGLILARHRSKSLSSKERDSVVTLTTYGELQIGPYTEGGAIGQTTALTPSLERQALVDILREAAVKARHAVLAIPLSASFVTTMSLEAPKVMISLVVCVLMPASISLCQLLMLPSTGPRLV
jgi:hypothetical protein